MTKTCPDCGQNFHADQPWKWLCLSCYIQRKRSQTENQTQQTIKKLQRRVQTLEMENAELRFRTFQPEPDGDVVKGLRDRWKDLILLCHPDRHSDNTRAHEATVWLNQIRKNL